MGTGHLRRERWEANERTLASHTRILGEISSAKYGDNATYDLSDYRRIAYEDGYQVAFIRPGANYNPVDYATMVNDFLRYVPGHKANATKVNGYPEITFRFTNLRTAMRLARKYKQVSIWDWANEEELLVKERRH